MRQACRQGLTAKTSDDESWACAETDDFAPGEEAQPPAALGVPYQWGTQDLASARPKARAAAGLPALPPLAAPPSPFDCASAAPPGAGLHCPCTLFHGYLPLFWLC
jgi:hypothetical protein